MIYRNNTFPIEKPFTCNDCNRAFSSKEKLKLHSKSHSNTRPHSCTHCEKSFIQKGHLVKHMKVHVSNLVLMQKNGDYRRVCFYQFPDAKLKCSLCTKSFTTEVILSKHALTHLRSKPYDCKYCQKPFKSYSHLAEHERTHVSEYY